MQLCNDRLIARNGLPFTLGYIMVDDEEPETIDLVVRDAIMGQETESGV